MTATPESLRQRYAAIELVYSERQWPQVESLSHALLVDLPDDPADPLRQRVVLLLGHTRLYGMGDVATARRHYEAVLKNGAEPTLRQIAEQGLEQCAEVARQQESGGNPTPPAEGQLFPFSAKPGAGPSQEGGEPAMPWLQAAAAGSGSGTALDPLAVEIIDEPEQIDVALADPQRREELELKELAALEPSEGVLQTLRRRDPEEEQELARGLLRVVLR
ncbi:MULTISPECIES: hypothetical protein [Aphanothece]|uniref:hypothetical protein n=1 Tax=Aphanothece TaxID=1121 RepID=UPI003984D6DA